jgi:murein L,D-transpeptidase YafK
MAAHMSPSLPRHRSLCCTSPEGLAAAVAHFVGLSARSLALISSLLIPPGFHAWAASPGAEQGVPTERADSLLIVKSEHRLYVMRDGQPLRSYPIALGLSPVGPKRQEYDFRTPEGRYVIDARRPNSRYFRALHVSYPNADDRKQAAERHVPPGGDIMIHGLPNVLHRPLAYYQTQDWTNGCIALSNDDLLEVWAMVRERIPVEIRP